MGWCYIENKNLLMVIIVVIAISIFNMIDVSAQEKDTTDPAIGGVIVEQTGEGEWKIIKQEGEFVGTLKSEKQDSFTFFDTSGVFMGTILESKAWFHRLYRKRDTRIKPEEARLYIDALKAIEIIKKEK